ncbi:hypothetical protein EDB81DRAFT_778909 [Dactylonectria macrodidyma]|uniref:Uncharacterized protein n=1 Tax=Dactylonectria macrodidyma TaxID=307937 RepID=A0A9P9JJC1_9HYPO|nr:hypothetical protein EDB81DRAFT_778909 [Dactylonectria macrodidyma]
MAGIVAVRFGLLSPVLGLRLLFLLRLVFDLDGLILGFVLRIILRLLFRLAWGTFIRHTKSLKISITTGGDTPAFPACGIVR